MKGKTMKPLKKCVCTIAALCGLSAFTNASPVAAETIVIEAGQVLLDAQSEPIPNARIIVEDGRIARIVKAGEAAPSFLYHAIVSSNSAEAIVAPPTPSRPVLAPR